MNVEVVRRGDTIYLRRVPYTRYFPTINQIKWRLKFAKAAEKTRGKRGFKDNLPISAAIIKEELKNESVGRRKKLKKYEEDLLAQAELKVMTLRHAIAFLIAKRKV